MKKVFTFAGILVVVLGFAATQAFGSGQQMGGSAGPGIQEGASPTVPGQMSPEMISAIASQVIGKKAQDQQGLELGQVEALATRNGQIVYVLISQEDNGDKLTPIPFRNSRFDTEADALVLMDVDGSTIAQAPSLTEDQLQLLNDPDFESRVHSYYGSQYEPESTPSEPSSPAPMQAPSGSTRPVAPQI